MHKLGLIITGLALIIGGVIIFTSDKNKTTTLYPNLSVFENDSYKILKQSGQEAVVVGRIKDEVSPSLWVGANRFPLNNRSWASHIFLRKQGIEPVYIMRTDDGNEHVRLGNIDGPTFEWIWGGLLTFEQDRPWSNTQIYSLSASDHEGRVVYVGYNQDPKVYNIVVEDKVIATWTHCPLTAPKFIAVSANKEEGSRYVVTYQVISDDGTSVITVIGGRQLPAPIETIR